MGRSPTDNLLARAAWLLADMRNHLSELNDLNSRSLVHRCDAYFEETYSYLKGQMKETEPEISSGYAYGVGRAGVFSMAVRVVSAPLCGSVKSTAPPSTSEVPSSNPLNGGGHSPEKKTFVDFF